MGDYNGWTNYETWNVALWLYNETREMARGVASEDDTPNARIFGDMLREYVDDLAEQTCPGCRTGASFVTDLLGAALSDVDWEEIASNLLEDVAGDD